VPPLRWRGNRVPSHRKRLKSLLLTPFGGTVKSVAEVLGDFFWHCQYQYRQIINSTIQQFFVYLKKEKTSFDFSVGSVFCCDFACSARQHRTVGY
jgi:hypothetical protein